MMTMKKCKLVSIIEKNEVIIAKYRNNRLIYPLKMHKHKVNEQNFKNVASMQINIQKIMYI